MKAYSRQRGLGDHLSETITRDLLMGGRPEGHSYRVFSYKDGASPSVASRKCVAECLKLQTAKTPMAPANV